MVDWAQNKLESSTKARIVDWNQNGWLGSEKAWIYNVKEIVY